MNFLLKISIVILVGIIGGKAARVFKLPNVSGYLVAGLFLGPSFLQFISSSDMESFSVINELALAVIAFSICYVAAENIFRKEIRRRWTITFLFGLIHGLGFASILREMSIPKSHLAVALVNFNLGIEAVQLSLVLLLLPLLSYIFKLKSSRKIVIYSSYAIVAMGAIWFIQRLFF